MNNTAFKINFTLIGFATIDSCYPQIDPRINEVSWASSLFYFLQSWLRFSRTGGEPDTDNATNSSQAVQTARFGHPFPMSTPG